MVSAVEPLAFGMADRLLTAAVQGAVAALAVWVVCRTFRDLSAALRATLWWLVSAKLLLALVPLPGVPVPVLPDGLGASRSAPTYLDIAHGPAVSPTPDADTGQGASRSSAVDIGQGASRSAPTDLDIAHGPAVPLTPDADTGQGASRPSTVDTGQGASRSAPTYPDAGTGALTFQNIVIALIGVWGLVLLVHGAALLRGLRHVHGILRRAWIDVDLDADVARLSPLVGLRVAPAARFSDDIAVPQVVGLWRPVLLFPSATTLSSDERAMALAHELMHIRRRDLAWGWIPALAERLFFFHPLARLASQEYLLAREAACDAAVVRALTVAPDAYGRLLVRLGIAASEPALAASGASPSFSSLRRRLEMLPHAAAARVTRRSLLLVSAVIAATIAPVQLVARHQSAPEVTPPTAQAAPPAPSVPVAAPATVAPPVAPTALPPPQAAPAAPSPLPPNAPASAAPPGPEGVRGILLDETLAEKLDVSVGDTVRLFNVEGRTRTPASMVREVRAIGSVVVLERQAQPTPRGTPFPSATPVEPASPFAQAPEPPRPAPVAAPFRSVTGVEPAVTFAQQPESPQPPDTAAPATAKPFYTSEAMRYRIAAARAPMAQEPSVAPAPAPSPATEPIEQGARRMQTANTLSFLMQEEESLRARLQEMERRIEQLGNQDAAAALELARDRAALEETLRGMHEKTAQANAAVQLEELLRRLRDAQSDRARAEARRDAAELGEAISQTAQQIDVRRLADRHAILTRLQEELARQQDALRRQQEELAERSRTLSAEAEAVRAMLQRRQETLEREREALERGVPEPDAQR